MNEQVEHVVALSADLKTSLDPVDRRRLEELRRLDYSRGESGLSVRCCKDQEAEEGRLTLAEEVLLRLRLRVAVSKRVEDVALEL